MRNFLNTLRKKSLNRPVYSILHLFDKNKSELLYIYYSKHVFDLFINHC